jgi:hypothetical protein
MKLRGEPRDSSRNIQMLVRGRGWTVYCHHGWEILGAFNVVWLWSTGWLNG